MNTRYWMVIGTFLLSMLLYIDRILISVAKTGVASSLSLSDKQMGWALSIFSLGYGGTATTKEVGEAVINAL
jgi:MFS transporter, ACS family, glucarate transporter